MHYFPITTTLMLSALCAVLPSACQQHQPQIIQGADIGATTPADKLFRAVFNGDLGEVEQSITEGADVNATDKLGHTPLRDAAAVGRNDIARLLLSAGADVNKGTPLLSAAGCGHREMVQILLKHGANIDQTDEDNLLGTPFMYAAGEGYRDVTQDLLAAGANINHRNKYGTTALIEAAENNHTEIISLLIQAGADVNIAKEDNKTALWYAAGKGNLAAAQELIRAGANVNAPSTEEGSILEIAITWAESKEMVKLLLQHGAKRNLSRGLIESSLHPESAFELPSDNLLDALEAAGYRHGISRDKTQKQKMEQSMQEIQQSMQKLKALEAGIR